MEDKGNVERLNETAIHDWYRMVFAYSDKLVSSLFKEFDADQGDLVLDPFNGTGTTTLTAKRRGIDSIGVDASPIAVLAGRCKTTWDIDLGTFRRRRSELLTTIEPVFERISADGNVTLSSFGDDPAEAVDIERYDFTEPKKIPKGWLSEKPLKKMLVLRHHIEEFPKDPVTDLFQLAMCAVLPEDVANVGFGPEAYKTKKQEDVDVYGLFSTKLEKMETDLRRVKRTVERGEIQPGTVETLIGDARDVDTVLRNESELLKGNEHAGTVDYVITSPPYPAEHDYTRNQRLELVWMGELEDNEDLQQIKKSNIRSNTKNIYVDDDDGERWNIRENDRIDGIVSEMERIIEEENVEHGFGQYYPRVVEEYFAGMQRHLEAVHDIMAPGGRAAYIVADSGSYWQVDIETGSILAELAFERVGFTDSELRLWRNLRATTGRKDRREEILVLEK